MGQDPAPPLPRTKRIASVIRSITQAAQKVLHHRIRTSSMHPRHISSCASGCFMKNFRTQCVTRLPPPHLVRRSRRAYCANRHTAPPISSVQKRPIGCSTCRARAHCVKSRNRRRCCDPSTTRACRKAPWRLGGVRAKAGWGVAKSHTSWPRRKAGHCPVTGKGASRAASSRPWRERRAS